MYNTSVDMKLVGPIMCVLLITVECSCKKHIPAFAIDCTTRKIISQGKETTIISRVTLVDENGQIVYDTKVNPSISRVRDEELNDGEEFSVVQQTINFYTHCRLIVGHNLQKVLNLLRLQHPRYLLRDMLFFYSSCKNLPDIQSSLKTLIKSILGKDISVKVHNTSENALAAMEIYKTYQEQWERHELSIHSMAFALDCEMVECLQGMMRREVVAKLSIVDHLGDVVYDNLFKPELPVSSYRTFVTGLRKENFTDAVYLSDERERLKSLLHGNIVVGHALGKDLALLGIHHPFPFIRDTSTFKIFRSYFPNKRTPSLKELARNLLNVTIQKGHHDSAEDAHATMMLYLKYRDDWDEEIQQIAKYFVNNDD